MVRRRLVVVLVGTLVAAGCGGGNDDEGGGAEPVAETSAVVPTAAEPMAAAEPMVAEATVAEPTATEPVAETTVAETMDDAGSQTSPVDEPVDGSPPPEGTEVCPLTGGDLEGCFDYDGMQAFYDEGIAAIIAYTEAAFTDPAVMQPAQWTFVEEGATGQEPCTDETGGFATYTDESYEYCPLDETVYIGQRELWRTYEQAGDAGAVIGMAHEAGHHMQAVAGVGGTGTREESIAMENQADCISGDFTGWLDSEGLLDYPDDLEDIDLLMPLIASAEDDPGRTHGTLEERINAFYLGYEQGIQACSDLFPESPIVLLE